jgi:hypothetical protein
MASIPEEFLCPITLQIMTDPVIGSDGRTYERTAILQWLRTNPHSPITREPMNRSALKPNYALKSAIERFRAPPLIPPPQPQPSAPPAAPAGDVYFAMNVYQQDLNQQLLNQQAFSRYGSPPQPTVPQTVVILPPHMAAERRKKLLGGCVLFTILLIAIIIFTRIYMGLSS